MARIHGRRGYFSIKAKTGGREHDPHEREDKTKIARGSPCLTINGLPRSYGQTRAIDELSLEINSGEIVGANGAGKTTLAQLICGLVVPDSGSIAFAFPEGADPKGRR